MGRTMERPITQRGDSTYHNLLLDVYDTQEATSKAWNAWEDRSDISAHLAYLKARRNERNAERAYRHYVESHPNYQYGVVYVAGQWPADCEAA